MLKINLGAIKQEVLEGTFNVEIIKSTTKIVEASGNLKIDWLLKIIDGHEAGRVFSTSLIFTPNVSNYANIKAKEALLAIGYRDINEEVELNCEDHLGELLTVQVSMGKPNVDKVTGRVYEARPQVLKYMPYGSVSTLADMLDND
jgi:hypothetical protein